ncbi:MAG TPA: amidohydrolase family protein [Vicinamibacteria bacterium]
MIDSHQHFWRYAPHTHGWIDDRMGALKRDFLPGDLEPLLRAHDFSRSIAVQAAQTLDETRFLLDLAGRHDFIAGVVGWVDLRSPSVEADLQELTAHKKLKGVRHVAQDEPDDRFLVRDDVLNGISALESFSLTYDILIYPRQLPAAAELVRRFPRQRFVLDHLAKPDIRSGALSPWRELIRDLAGSSNVCCKISGLVTEASWTDWKPEDLWPYLDVVFECFRAERLMIGSDWPVCTLAGDYGRVMGVVKDYLSRRSAAEQRAVLGATAARVYGLEAPR